jgi:chromosome segregation ATPase
MRFEPSLLLGATLSLGLAIPLQALAQASAPAKPARSVTKDELRVCMNSESDMKARREALLARQATDRTEIEAIKAEKERLTNERKDIDESNQRRVSQFKREMDAFNARVKAATAEADAFQADAETLNKALIAHNEKCGGITYDPDDKAAILKEREAASK